MFAKRWTGLLNLVRSGIDDFQLFFRRESEASPRGYRPGRLMRGRMDFGIVARIDGFLVDVHLQGAHR